MTQVSSFTHNQTAFDPVFRHGLRPFSPSMSSPRFLPEQDRFAPSRDLRYDPLDRHSTVPSARQNTDLAFSLPPISTLLEGISRGPRAEHEPGQVHEFVANIPYSHPFAGPAPYHAHPIYAQPSDCSRYSTLYPSRRKGSGSSTPRSAPPLAHSSMAVGRHVYPEPPSPRTTRSSVDSTVYSSASRHRQSWQSQTSQAPSAPFVYQSPSANFADSSFRQLAADSSSRAQPDVLLPGASLSTSPTASMVNLSPENAQSQWQSQQSYFTPAGTGAISGSSQFQAIPLPTPAPPQQAQQQHERYVCPTCAKAFSRPSSLRIHSHSHTGHKPFRCPRSGCGKAFSVRSNMKRHERGCHVDGATRISDTSKAESAEVDVAMEMAETGSEEDS